MASTASIESRSSKASVTAYIDTVVTEAALMPR